MISLTIFQPRRWADADARKRQQKKSVEQLKDEVRHLFLQKPD